MDQESEGLPDITKKEINSSIKKMQNKSAPGQHGHYN